MVPRFQPTSQDGPRYLSRRAIVAGASALLILSTVLVTVLLMRPAHAYPGRSFPAGGRTSGLGSRLAVARASRTRSGESKPRSDEASTSIMRTTSGTPSIPTSHQRWDVDTGRIPFINWRADTRWSSIANGSEDDWIRDRADAFVEFGAPVYLTFHHEPEDDLSGVRRPGRVRGGVPACRLGVPQPRGYERRVRVEHDGLDVQPSLGEATPTRTTQETTTSTSSAAMATTAIRVVPVIHGIRSSRSSGHPTTSRSLTGSRGWSSNTGSRKTPRSQVGRVIGSGTRCHSEVWPSLKAAIYFDVDKDYDWRTDTSESSMQGYREIANDPWFLQGAGTPFPNAEPDSDAPPGGTRPVLRNGLNAGPQGATHPDRGE